MKVLLLCSIFLINILFADYNSDTQNKGKIDMHGGKSEMLINNKNSLSNTNFNNLNDIEINKPSDESYSINIRIDYKITDGFFTQTDFVIINI